MVSPLRSTISVKKLSDLFLHLKLKHLWSVAELCNLADLGIYLLLLSVLLSFLFNTFIDILKGSWSLCCLVSLAFRKCSEVLVACEDIEL